MVMDTENEALKPTGAPLVDAGLERRKVAYHEAAHAVVFWNLGFGVTSITVNRVRFCGRVFSPGNPKDRSQRVGRAVAGVAGLSSQVLLGEMTWDDVGRSACDLFRAYGLYSKNSGLTDGEQLGVGLALARRTEALVRDDSVRRQIESLAKPLLRDGRMFQATIHRRLAQHPETSTARVRCRDFVREIDLQHDEIVAKVAGFAPEFRWPESL